MPDAPRVTPYDAGRPIAASTAMQVMAIGDNYNDIDMLTFAGHPVIMGNASDDLKQNGWTITLHNDASGVAAAILEILDQNAAVLHV